MNELEPDGRAVRPVDALLSELFDLYTARDDAINAICRTILENPQLDAQLSKVVHRLEATK